MYCFKCGNKMTDIFNPEPDKWEYECQKCGRFFLLTGEEGSEVMREVSE